MKQPVWPGLVLAALVAGGALGAMGGLGTRKKAAPIRVVGRIVEQGGFPVPFNTLVALGIQHGESGPDVGVEDDGSFQLDLSPTISDRFLLLSVSYHPAYNTERMLPGYENGVGRRRIRIPKFGPRTVNLGTITLPEAPGLGSVMGRVRAKTPVGTASIHPDAGDLFKGDVRYPMATHVGITGSANAPYLHFHQDSFLLAHAPPGRYRLGLSAPGYQEEWVELSIHAGKTESVPDVILRPGTFRVAGHVLDRQTGRPIPKADVSAWSGPDYPWIGSNTIPSKEWGEADAKGNFRLRLRVRTIDQGVAVRVKAEGYESAVVTLGAERFEANGEALIRVKLHPEHP